MTIGNDSGISELIDETLILVLVVVTAGIVGFLLLGYIVPIEKTAYVVPAFATQSIAGKTVITAFDRGGDPLYFNVTPLAKYRAIIYVETALGVFRAEPDPGLKVFRPGDTIYVYYTGSAFKATDSLSGVIFSSLPSGRVAIRFVDANSGTLIAQETVVQGPAIVLPVTNTTPAPTPISSVTATSTPTPVVTTSATPAPAALVASFTWIEKGKGGDIHFTDTSTGTPTSWSWSFGDGSTSTNQNPVHNFGKGAGSPVTLTITRSSDGATGSITQTITTI